MNVNTILLTLICSFYNKNKLLLPFLQQEMTPERNMKRGILIETLNTRPQEQLHFISMTEDLEQRFSPDRRGKNKLNIEPWQDEQQNPSQSPERRCFFSRPSAYPSKIQKTSAGLKLYPTKALESSNQSNFAIRLRNTSSRPSCNDQPSLYKIQSSSQTRQRQASRQCRSQRNDMKLRRNSMCSNGKQGSQNKMTGKQYEIGVSSLKTPVNMIVYPMLNQGNRRKLFRKMQKFQNFVSVSLRK